jgi:hypothetical protein
VSKGEQSNHRAVVFLAAYAIRKLADSYKISSSFAERSMPCTAIPTASNRTDLLHKQPIADHCDFAKIKSVGKSAALREPIHLRVNADMIP